jgi:uncharacterized membrane protein YbaN (DUF454 family)
MKVHDKVGRSPGLASASKHSTAQRTDPILEIELDSRIGRLRVSDPRLFGPSRRQLGRRLVEVLCNRKGVRRVALDCETSTCWVDFDLDVTDREVMAEIFKASLQTVLKDRRKSWWRPRNSRWTTLVAYRHQGVISLWESASDTRGRLRLVNQESPRSRAGDLALADRIASLAGVESCVVSRWSRRITVTLHRPVVPSVPMTLAGLEAILEGRLPGEAGTASPEAPALVAGWKRPVYVALAGGAFTLTLVGLAVPGVPTVPFLVATSYYLGRSSPGLNERLRHAPFFGPVLREWEDHGALSPGSKARLAGLTGVIVLATVLTAPVGPISLGVILLISSLGIYGIASTPNLIDEQPYAAGMGTEVLAPLAPC